MTVKIIEDATFEKKTATGVSITDFWATWCWPLPYAITRIRSAF
ncbi:Thioredoxin [Leuconostoc inhae]|uniref:Thioredoxin n=1 Tax=Leuconostoc inhae TaxID=178001 RepID=A0ABP2B9R0_9LACO|nr:Thioredoxin [Leuconostoc inhae]